MLHAYGGHPGTSVSKQPCRAWRVELDRAGDDNEGLSTRKAGSGGHSRSGLVSHCGTWCPVHRANPGARLTWKATAPGHLWDKTQTKYSKAVFNHFIGQWLKTKALGVMVSGLVLWLLFLLLRGRHSPLPRAPAALLRWRMKYSMNRSAT